MIENSEVIVNITESNDIEVSVVESTDVDINMISGSTDWNDIINQPDIPTKVSDLENDSDFATNNEVDDKIAEIPVPDVSGQISTHNISNTAHSDIRTLISNEVSRATGVEATKASISNLYNSAEIDTNGIIGQPVYIKSNGHIDLAIANSVSTSKVSGILNQNAVLTTSAQYINNCILNISNWTNIAGTSSLVPNNYYYLSPTEAGKITNTAPTSVNQYVVKIGQALTSNILQIEIEQPIKL